MTEKSRPRGEIRVRPEPGLTPETQAGVLSPLPELLKLPRPRLFKRLACEE